ncbi:hypothetical protein GJ496_007003 [Pomphorhynchus laevis]|nr:hypothetical protein GJ496_007003 [Pomphorhynchus laevis]
MTNHSDREVAKDKDKSAKENSEKDTTTPAATVKSDKSKKKSKQTVNESNAESSSAASSGEGSSASDDSSSNSSGSSSSNDSSSSDDDSSSNSSRSSAESKSSSSTSEDESSSVTSSSSSSPAVKRRKHKKRAASVDDKPGAPKKIHVGKLTRNITKDHVKEIFSTYGTVKSVDMPMDRIHQHLNRGYAYVQYQYSKQAEMAFKFMNDGMIDGQTITVALILPAVTMESRRSPPNHCGGGPSGLPGRHNFNNNNKWSQMDRHRRPISPAITQASRKRRFSRSSTRSY